jgi:hypothetical protein
MSEMEISRQPFPPNAEKRGMRKENLLERYRPLPNRPDLQSPVWPAAERCCAGPPLRRETRKDGPANWNAQALTCRY